MFVNHCEWYRDKNEAGVHTVDIENNGCSVGVMVYLFGMTIPLEDCIAGCLLLFNALHLCIDLLIILLTQRFEIHYSPSEVSDEYPLEPSQIT